LPDYRGLLIDAAREIATEGVKAYVNTRLTPGTASAGFPHAVKVVDATTECPYCEIALYLSGARTYLQRMQRAVASFKDVYRDLTLSRIDQAIEISRKVPNHQQSVRIYSRLREISYELESATALSRIDRLIDEMLDLAESTGR